MNRTEMLRKLLFGEDPLELSIQKWQDIVDGKGVDDGPDNCALCEKFYDKIRFGGSYCEKCPVSVRVGKEFCAGTPREDRESYRGFISQSEQELKRLAQLELDFLKSLRPKEAV